MSSKNLYRFLEKGGKLLSTTKISKGIHFHFIESKKFKTTAITVLLRRQLSKEEATINAIIPSILKRGSAKYFSVSEIHRKTENLYGAIFDAMIMKKGEEQVLQFFIEVVKKDKLTEDALEFLKEVILNPLIENGKFDKEIVDGEKANLAKGIKGRVNDKKEYAKLRCLEESCTGEPFGIYGDGYLEDIENLNEKNIYEQYQKIIQTSPIDIIVIGNEDEKALAQCISLHYGLQREQVQEINKASAHIKKEKELIIKETMDVTQGKICMTFRSGIESTGVNFYKLMLMNELFGGSSNSKLFSSIREKESLCYNINSLVFRFKTIVFVQSGVEEKNFEKVIELVKQELKSLSEKNIQEDEFKNAKKSIINKFKSIEDYSALTMDFYLTQYMLNDTDTLEDVQQKFAAITMNDVADIAKLLYLDTIYLLGKGKS